MMRTISALIILLLLIPACETEYAGQETRRINELDETANYLLENVRAGDLVIVFSAGDAVEISAKVFTGLIEQEVAA